MYDFWSLSSWVVQLFLGLFLNVPNCLFSNTILEMGIYLTVDDVMFVLLTWRYESIVGKAAIVTVVMFNMHNMTSCKLFEGFLPYDCFLWGDICHEVYVPDPGEVVNKDGCCPLSTFGEFSLELSNEANLGNDHLINRCTFTTFCSFENMSAITCWSFCSPCFLCHGPSKTSSMCWWLDLGEMLENFSLEHSYCWGSLSFYSIIIIFSVHDEGTLTRYNQSCVKSS